MKRLITLLFVLMLTVVSVFAQAPQKMSYQAVVRNANNTLVTNQNVSVRISVLQGSATGSAVYVETHNVQTNANGLMTVEVGTGLPTNGSFDQINWGQGPFYLKSEIDPEGGINYSIEGVQQLLSVPYALYAQSAGNVPAFAITPTDTGYVLVLTMGNGTTQSYILRNGQDGAQGPAGPAGPQGPAGPAGQNGQDGAPGAQGPAGPAGAPGYSPIITSANLPGGTLLVVQTADTTFSFTIPNGQNGQDGAPGANGQSAYELWIAQGNTGTVAQFLASLHGTNGADGLSAYQLWLNQGNTGNEAAFLASLVGAQGPAGPAGTQGPAGPAGAQGPAGPAGAPGYSPIITSANLPGGTLLVVQTADTTFSFTIPNGQNGQDGAPGANGQSAYELWIAQGNTGTVAQFLASLHGTNGADGLSAYQLWLNQGNTGNEAAFLASLVGAQGPAGPAGTQGPAGPAGAQGPAGPAGAQGPAGPAGANGISPTVQTLTAGDSTIVTITDVTGSHTFVVYNGQVGPMGPQGPVGPTGAAGAAGANGLSAYQIWLNAGNTGTEDEFLASLVGAPGNNGNNGNDGAPGRGISSITGPVTNGLVDTYTINYTDNTTSTFVVTNGAQGEPGVGVAQTLSVSGNQLTISEGNTVTLPTAGGGDGLSAYQIWLNAGHTGTEADFLASLIGAAGNGISSITGPVTAANVDTYTINFTDGSTYTFDVTNGVNGNDGNDGNGITSITGPVSAGNVDTYTINFTNGNHTTFSVTNGEDGENGDSAYQLWLEDGHTGTMADFFNSLKGPQGEAGNGIYSVTGPVSAGNVDTYTITYTDGTTSTFNVTNGTNGTNGRGIDNVTSTTSGLVDTYTIHYTDGSSYNFTVNNGATGATGAPGKGISSITGPVSAGNVDTYTINYTDGSNDHFNVTNGTNGANGVSPTITVSAVSGGVAVTIVDANGSTTTTIPTTSGESTQLPANWTETDATSAQFILNKPVLATVATTGDYNDLTNTPTLAPVATSGDYNDLTNKPTIPTQQNADWNATSGVQQILNKPTLATVATTGNYSDLNGTPTLATVATTGNYSDLNGTPAINNATLTIKQGTTVLGTFTANSGDNVTVTIPQGFSGDYNDLTNKPTIPTVNDATLTIKQGTTELGTFTANAGTNKTITIPQGFSGDYNDLNNKPAINDATLTIKQGTTELGTFTANAGTNKTITIPAGFSGNYSDLVGAPTLATVATTGNYNDLTNKPTIPAAQVNADWNATSGAAEILNKPTLFSGDYNDLTNTPTIPTVPTNVSDFTNDAGYITSADVPTNVSDLNNDAGYITSADVPAQVQADWDETDATEPSYIQNKPILFSGDWNDLSGVAPAVSTFTNDAGYITSGDVVPQVQADWNETDNTMPSYIQNKPENLSDFTNDAGYIIAADLPAQTQANWDETDATSSAYIQNKPVIPEAQVQADWDETDATSKAFIQNKPDMSNFLTASDLSNAMTGYVSLSADETVGGNKEFTGDNVFTGTVEVPSVLNTIDSNDDLVLDGTNNCEQAVNFCDLQTVYDEILSKFNALNDQIDDLLDSIADLNKQMNTPKDGEACPNTPTVTDYDGNTYSTVRIGNQCWMRENMRVRHEPNGTAIDSSGALSTTARRFTAPNAGSSMISSYGLLYNSMAVLNGNTPSVTAKIQGICPPGWYVPTPADFQELKTYASQKYGSNYVKALSSPLSWTSSTSSYSPGYHPENNNALGFSMIRNTSSYADLWNSNAGDAYWQPTSTEMSIWGGNGVQASNLYGVRCLRGEMNGENNTVNAPTVHTLDTVYNITQNQARIGRVQITDNGGMPITKYGIFVSTNSLPTQANSVSGSPAISGSPANLPYTSGTYQVSGLSTNTLYYFRAYAINAIDTAYGEVKSFHTVEDGQPCPGLTTYQDINGNTYNTIMIGSQCWLKENLKVTKAADNTDIAHSDPTYNSNNAGYKYSWSVAMNGSTVEGNRGICPLGWHVPTVAEFRTLKTYVGTPDAKKLAATSGWSTSSVANTPGNNQSSNNAQHYNFLAYQNHSITSNACSAMWTSSKVGSSSYRLLIYPNVDTASVPLAGIQAGNTAGVRCIKDASTTAQITAPTITLDLIDNTTSSASYYLKRAKYSVTGGTFSLSNYYLVYDTIAHPTRDKCSGMANAHTSYSDCVIFMNLVAGKTYYARVFAYNSTLGYFYSNEVSFVAPESGTRCPEALSVSDYNGNTYPTVKIGSQCWTAQNLRSTTYPGNNGSITNYSTSDLTNYGRLYSRTNIMHGSSTSTSSVQGMCPNGWHIPSRSEFTTLLTTVNNSAVALASRSGWTSSTETNAPGNNQLTNNASGFNAFPAGYYSNGEILHSGEQAWIIASDSCYLYMKYDQPQPIVKNSSVGSYIYSLRCIKGATPPSVATSSTVTKSANTATVGGTVYTNGGTGVTTVGICYSSTNDVPTISDATKTATAQLGNFTVNLTNLPWGTTIYYRAYATNANGTQYGEVKSFVTKPRATVTTTQSVSNLTQTTATVYGSVSNTSSGSVAQYGFYLYKMNAGGTPGNSSDYTFVTNPDVAGSPTSSFSYTFTNLEPGAYYAVKAEVQQTIDGVNTWISASNLFFFRTLCVPAVTTDAIQFTGTSSIQFRMNGTITEVGNPSYTEKGFVWTYGTTTPSQLDLSSTSNAYHATVSGTSSGAFNYLNTTSHSGEKVYCRAYAKNSQGTVYGEIKSYTLPSLPSVSASGIYYSTSPDEYSANTTTSSMKVGVFYSATGGSNIYEIGVVWAPVSSGNSTPTVGGSSCHTQAAASVPAAVGSRIPVTVTGLVANTAYYVRAYAKNAAGIAYSTDIYTVRTKLNCGQTLVDQNNYGYSTINVNGSCWMASNLRANTLDDNQHTAISLVTSSSVSATTPYRYYPNGSSSYASSGYLYNLAAAKGIGGTYLATGQGVCPRGWHIPTSDEISTLRTWLNTTSNFASFNSQYAGYVSSSGPARFGEIMCIWYGVTSTSGILNVFKSDFSTSAIGYSGTNAESVRCVQD